MRLGRTDSVVARTNRATTAERAGADPGPARVGRGTGGSGLAEVGCWAGLPGPAGRSESGVRS